MLILDQQGGCDLRGGSLLPAPPDSFSTGTTTVITNDATTLNVRDNVLVSTPRARFMRVKVTAAP